MKKFICCLVLSMAIITALICVLQLSDNVRNAPYGVQVDWDEPWTFNGETLYYGTYVKDYAKEVIDGRYLTRSQWETIIEARSKGLMVNPL